MVKPGTAVVRDHFGDLLHADDTAFLVQLKLSPA